MRNSLVISFILSIITTKGARGVSSRERLPTLYEYYSPTEGERVGLAAEADGFKLNGLPIRLISGSIHYFRVHPDYWRDRLKRLRATGANAVDTYVPWNLHEPEMSHFDFGDTGNDMSPFLDIRGFIQTAHEEDLLVVLRPGPYICAEFEFGGLPSWLLRDPNMQVRTNYPGYLNRVKTYFARLLREILDLQWTKGGPIVMVQIENEYGSFGINSTDHLVAIKEILKSNGIQELLFTADSPLILAWRGQAPLPDVLQAANFGSSASEELDTLLKLQPNKPIYVAELWSGWFDHWFQRHHSHVSTTYFESILETILGKYNGSVNFYMFHGGTNFGFLNGANVLNDFPYYMPQVTSYDYDAPLSESGKYTDKYAVILELVEKHKIVDISRPHMPPQKLTMPPMNVTIQDYLTFEDLIQQVPDSLRTHSADPISMELLDINGGSGQSYGFIVYRTKVALKNGSRINIGRPRDELSILVDGIRKTQDGALLLSELQNFGYWTVENQTFTLELESEGEKTLDLLVENWGRVNFGRPAAFHQQKGLFNQSITIDGEVIQNWEIIPLEFKGDWVRGLNNWRRAGELPIRGPVMTRSFFTIEGEPQDTFLDTSEWYKGNVFINGFNLGRYYKAGPTKTMYIAAPFLNTGINTVVVFELFQTGGNVVLTDQENLRAQSRIS